MIASGSAEGGLQSGIVLPPGTADDTETVRIASVQGGVSRQAIEGVGALVSQKPGAAKDAVEDWLASNATG